MLLIAVLLHKLLPVVGYELFLRSLGISALRLPCPGMLHSLLLQSRELLHDAELIAEHGEDVGLALPSVHDRPGPQPDSQQRYLR